MAHYKNPYPAISGCENKVMAGYKISYRAINQFHFLSLLYKISGIHHATLDQQLEGFSLALTQAAGSLPLAKPDSWLKAFEMLKQYLTPVVKK